MREMSQGEDYIEDEVDSDLEQEAGEDTGENKIFGVDKKIFVIGVIAFVFIVMLLIVILMFKNRGSDEVVSDDDFDIDEWISNQESQTDMQSTPSSNFATNVYSEDWQNRYEIDGDSYSDGFNVVDSNGKVVGTFSTTSGAPLLNAAGNVVGYLVTESGSDEDAGTMVSDEDTIELRKLGYTGDEIEFAKQNNISMETLIAEAEAIQDEAAKEALIRMSDYASEEFQFVYNNSIISLGEIPYMPVNQLSGDGASITTGSYIVNADYEKMPTYGLRLYFKVKIANNTYTFMDVTPTQWDSYPDSGNMIVKVYFQLYSDQTSGAHLYITQLEEVDITNLTVNPEESGVDLERAVGLE